MQKDGPIFEQAPASDLRPHRVDSLDLAAVRALEPRAVVEVVTGPATTRQIVRGVVLASIPAPVSPPAGSDNDCPCWDNKGQMHFALLPQRQHCPEVSNLFCCACRAAATLPTRKSSAIVLQDQTAMLHFNSGCWGSIAHCVVDHHVSCVRRARTCCCTREPPPSQC